MYIVYSYCSVYLRSSSRYSELRRQTRLEWSGSLQKNEQFHQNVYYFLICLCFIYTIFGRFSHPCNVKKVFGRRRSIRLQRDTLWTLLNLWDLPNIALTVSWRFFLPQDGRHPSLYLRQFQLYLHLHKSSPHHLPLWTEKWIYQISLNKCLFKTIATRTFFQAKHFFDNFKMSLPFPNSSALEVSSPLQL